MPGFSVDGLISGLNTTSIINSLMAVAAQPQAALQAKVANDQTVIRSYQGINSAFSSLSTAAKTLAGNTPWQSVTVTSSSPSVAASGTTASSTGRLDFDVNTLAAAHSIRSDEITGLDTSIAPGTGIDLTTQGKTTHIDLTDTSLQGVVNAINSTQDTGVSAAAVKVRDGVYRLQLTAAKTGQDGQFDVSGLNVGTAVGRQASDAQITVGTGAGAYTVTSSSNTFTGVLPGASFTVSTLESGVTLSTGVDAGGIADKIQAMVDAANGGLGQISLASSYNSTDASKSGPLAGDYTVRQLGQNLSATMYTAVGADGSFAQAGLQLSRDGTLTFDRDTFLAAYQADPAKTQRLVTGLASGLQKGADGATNSTNGSITLAIQGRNAEIRTLNTGIADWNVRLADQRNTLMSTYAHLESTLSTLKSQGAYLSQQLAA